MTRHCRIDDDYTLTLDETIQYLHNSGIHVAGLILVRFNDKQRAEAQIMWSYNIPKAGERQRLLQTLAQAEED